MVFPGSLKHQLIVSVQADEGEPLASVEILFALVQSVLSGGAAGLRLAKPELIRRVKKTYPDIPVIGLTKPPQIPANAAELVYITPNWKDVQILADAGADIIAMDATQRPRPNQETLAEIVTKAREDYPDVALMADIATLREGMNAAALGFDCVSTTLSGYTTETVARKSTDPDWELLSALVDALSTTSVILEGRVWTPEQAKRGLALGAYAVVVGSAITRPHHITQWFSDALKNNTLESSTNTKLGEEHPGFTSI